MRAHIEAQGTRLVMAALETPFTNREQIRIPDFIIAGAMKCGTSSLHGILARHPEVFIPAPEIHFHDADDLLQHPDFVLFREDRWHHPVYGDELARYRDWYASFYAAADAGQMLGEDSTTYLASERAAERIAKLNPDTKIIVMLRDPASRTYSHYWHLVRTGRALWSFEDSIQFSLGWNLIERSLYKRQIKFLFQHIPRKNVLFIISEEFFNNMLPHVMKTCEFLGVDGSWYNSQRATIHENRAQIPRSLRVQLWRNRLLRGHSARRYGTHLPWLPKTRTPWHQQVIRLVDRGLRHINPLRAMPPPPMKPCTRHFLNSFFAYENDGLEDLIGKKVTGLWYRG